ncbi:MAG: Rpn family recombination-promoting nuclease/putative transposase [Lachnospiraceae bacterium]|jgi:hypothetical protein|nr:Rpn family recombination-promoting nuclease/putative transposase [Lachnospiraceae bacterium]
MNGKLRPTNDLMFKKTFGSIGNEDIIKGFAADFFMVTSGKIIVANPYSIEAYEELDKNGGKTTMLRETLADITFRAEIESLTMEMQVSKTDYFDRRMLYYACDKYRSEYSAQQEPEPEEKQEDGEKEKPNRYKSLRPLYALDIIGYNYFPDDYAFHKFDLYDIDHKIKFTDKKTGKDLFAISCFEYKKPCVEIANHRYWQMYFQGLDVPNEAPSYIKRAEQLLDLAKLSEKERKMYAECEKRKADMDAYISTAWSDGEASGVELGKAQERTKTLCSAAVLLRKTDSWEMVKSVFPDITEDEIKQVTKNAKLL